MAARCGLGFVAVLFKDFTHFVSIHVAGSGDGSDGLPLMRKALDLAVRAAR